MPDPTIKDGIINTCKEHGLPLDFQAYFLTMVELAGGDLTRIADDHKRFITLFESNCTSLGIKGAMCIRTTTQNDPRTG